MIKDAFEDDPRFLTTRDKAFQEVVNDTSIFKLELVSSRKARGSIESRCPELLANFCDMMLRKSSVAKKLTSEEIEEKLNSVLRVLKYVQNRDVFMRCHKHHLTRRLILENSADQEKEEWMVGRLREHGMPADHIGKLQKMLQDIEINKDLNRDFKRSLGSNNNKNISETINVKILNSGAWDRSPDDKGIVTLPREIEEIIPEVDSFYKEKHSGRKLQWCPHLSHATITFGTNHGQYDLDVTTFQMTVLFCWNDRADEKISLASLKLATEIPEVELNKTLLSLIAFPKSKQQILLCDCPSMNPKDFTESTLFWINKEFAIIKGSKPQKHGRMSVIGRLPLTIEQLNRREHDDIIALRELRTQEAIVKIMKTRKTMTSAQLETELVEILKPLFLPSKRLVKEQIEWLIEQRYIRRKTDQINEFEYVS
uniref:Cullin-5 n=1 Tax=Steinernema glaseri TaxID=37863 RepID=A0A1I7ZH63_9BILA